MEQIQVTAQVNATDQTENNESPLEYNIKTFRSQLNHVSAPYFQHLKELEEKVAYRSNYLQELKDCVREDRLPKAIVRMRIPQVPKNIDEEYRKRFEAITNQAAKQTVQLLVECHTASLSALIKEREAILTKVKLDIKESPTYVTNNIENCTELMRENVLKEYLFELEERIGIQRKRIAIRTGFDKLNKKKQRDELLKKKIANMELENAEPTVQTLREKVKGLQKKLSNLQRKGIPNTKSFPKGQTLNPRPLSPRERKAPTTRRQRPLTPRRMGHPNPLSRSNPPKPKKAANPNQGRGAPKRRNPGARPPKFGAKQYTTVNKQGNGGGAGRGAIQN